MNEYLKNINFTTNEIPKFIREYLGNMRIVVLLIIALLIGGFLSFKSLPQTVAPEINLSMIIVSSSLPGATPENVETLLTVPIEDELKGLSDIDTITSVSENSYMYSVLTFNRGINQSKALNDTENVLRRVSDLPQNATDPTIKAVNFEDSPIIRLALTIDDGSQTDLNNQAQKLIDALEDNPMIDRVVTAGQPEQEVQITISSEKISSLGIKTSELQSIIKNAVSTLPSGTVEDIQVARSLTINTSIDNVDDLRLLPFTINFKNYTLGDIATIAERPAPGHVNAWLSNGETLNSVVTLDIYRTTGTNLNEAAVVAEDIINKVVTDTNGSLHQTVLMNIANDLNTQFNDLAGNLNITILLVFITLMLFVGWRQALFAAFSIPLTYAVAFIVMGIMDISVNFLSLFSLLLSLGLLVDVTIVVVSAMNTYMREGTFNSYKTGLLVYHDFFKTLLITTLTTVWAFVPLLLSGGIMGEYLRPIPIIVGSILLSSVFIGIFIILPIMIWLFSSNSINSLIPKRVRILFIIIIILIISFLIVFIFKLPIFFVLLIISLVLLLGASIKILFTKSNYKNKKNTTSQNTKILNSTKSVIHIRALEQFYKKILNTILSSQKNRRKTIAIVVIFFIFSFGLVATGFVKNEFFPGEDQNYFFVSIELPEGTKSSITEKTAREILPTFAQLDGVTNATAQIGFEVNKKSEIVTTSPNIALFTVLTPKKEDGGIGSQVVSQAARNLPIISEFTKGKITVSELTGGPPAGADVVVTFVGDDISTLRKLANTLKDKVDGKLPIENISISPRIIAATVEFVPDDTVLANLGLTKEIIASQLHLFATGFTLADDVEFNNLDKKRDIVLRFEENVPNLETLGQLMITTPNGKLPLESLGQLKLSQNVSKIERKDFDRTVTLTANLSDGANLVDVNKQIAEIVDSEIVFPTGYSWTTGGANEENQKSVQSILKGMLLAFVLIFLTLIIHLKSYRKAMIVLLTIPLAVSGVFIVFAIMSVSLSFPALIGLLALFGVVVNNAIIIISQINANQKVGMNYKQSITEGASSRLEPILLSSLTTIVGLLPITLSNPVWQGLGGAIISGLFFSGVIMLFFIPTVYYAIMKDEM